MLPLIYQNETIMKKATISTKKSTLIGTFVKWEDNNDFLGSLCAEKTKKSEIRLVFNT